MGVNARHALDALLHPSSVAIIGASVDPLRIGGRPIAYMRSQGFTGRILPVAGTPLDFRRPAAVGGRLARLDIGGYDHNYVIDGGSDPLALAAELYEPESGRAMEVLTTKPGIQLYTGNFLDGLAGKGGALYQRHAALCLETQYFPDAIHHPAFPSPVLRPGQTYRHTTIHRFSCR